MGSYLESKDVGDKILMKGPVGRLTYKGNCMIHFTTAGKDPIRVTKLGLLAGGSGITPLFSIMDAIYRARESCIEVKMLYSNKTVNDILLRSELDAINADESSPNISVAHTLTRELGDLPAPLLKGHVNIEMLR
jgi:ferredoxin-NADP reductase